jgi:hypothetical protein
MAMAVSATAVWYLGLWITEDSCLDGGHRFVVRGLDHLCEAGDGTLSAPPPLTATARVLGVTLWVMVSSAAYAALAWYVNGGRRRG